MHALTVFIWNPFAMPPAGVSKTTVAKPAFGSYRLYDAAKIKPSSNRPGNSI